MDGHGVQAVGDFGDWLNETLEAASLAKGSSHSVEPPLLRSDLSEYFLRVGSIFSPNLSSESKKHAIEIACRDTFNNLLAITTIDSPSFVKLWNLLDIISVLEDDEHAELTLLFWLVEELLDSQTISGCRKIFDYLESRRERITAKRFQAKQLIILRSCNELLRRLSRAEDTAFCGRVFIFMFQSFPLGDKSSVNLRGEFHTENVTTFDALPAPEIDPERMDIEPTPELPVTKVPLEVPAKKLGESGNAKGVTFSMPVLTADELYPQFWSLQQYFSQPKKLFEAENFATFKSGLEATMNMFKAMQSTDQGGAADDSKRGTKRKRGQSDDDLANAFNPKYLTNRDLFELELSDLSFRRHILVQILITLDFMLSLSAEAKQKLAKATIEKGNMSVMYADQLLSEKDADWCVKYKEVIERYLKGADGRYFQEGQYFHRIVETVLSRDKNWVRWKIENCPSIARPSIPGKEFTQVKSDTCKTASKRQRLNTHGSIDVKFLHESETRQGLDRLKESARSRIPAVASFKAKISDDDFDIDMARDDETKTQAAKEAKASKTWRVLRIASTTKLIAFDKIENPEKVNEIFQEQAKPEEPVEMSDDIEEISPDVHPKDRRPIVITGPSGVGKGTLVEMLLKNHGTIFTKGKSHTTRPPRKNEINGVHYHFVSKEEFDILRDGDQFLEFNNFNGNDYGKRRKEVEDIIASGKNVVMEMDYHGILQLKDANFSARFIFLAPPNMAELEARLNRRGMLDAETIKKRLKIAEKEIEKSKVAGFHDVIFINDDLEATYKKLHSYIFSIEESTDGSSPLTPPDEVAEVPEIANVEVEMADMTATMPEAAGEGGGKDQQEPE